MKQTLGMLHLPPATLVRIVVLGLAALGLYAWGSWRPSPAAEAPALTSQAPRVSELPTAAPIASDQAVEREIRFLEGRVRQSPNDHVAYNKLAGHYAQRLRETGQTRYLDLQFQAARGSLAAVLAERNVGGLAALAQAEHSAHNFAAARDHARRLIELDPAKSYPYGMLGDALLELGAYEEASEAFRQMVARGRGNVGTETRLARLASLRGETDAAQRHLFSALALALDLPAPPRETVAWCRWQSGELAFSVGDYETAERHYRDALTTFPDYVHAIAALGRVRAAQGDLAGAIGHYEDASLRLPDPTFVATLGDLYILTGRERDAARQYALVEQIARLGELNGALYNRQVALFYADHDLQPAEAYASALKEYELRRDVYGADAVAWTALKAGKLAEAQAAIQDALLLGTRDARLWYHAGLIARAAGDEASARDHLRRALALNPRFDPLQAPIAERTLSELPIAPR